MISATRLANPNHARSHFPDEAVKFEKKRLKFKTTRKLRFILEESIECTQFNKRKSKDVSM